MKQAFLKNKFYKHSFLSSLVLVSMILFFATQQKLEAVGKTDFVGKCTVQIPMATCSNTYTCSSCSLCGCGSWDQITVSPIYGKTADSSGGYYICKMPAFSAMGSANLEVGSSVFGHCSNNQFSIYNPSSCNVWSWT